MTKTTPLNDDTHRSIMDAQNILEQQYGINMKMQDIVSCIAKDKDQIVEMVIKTKMEQFKNGMNETNIKNGDDLRKQKHLIEA